MKIKIEIETRIENEDCYSFMFWGIRRYVYRNTTDYGSAQLFKEIDEEVRKIDANT